jgi:hypothetical protein
MVLKESDFDEEDVALSCGMGFEAACLEFECELWRNPREREPSLRGFRSFREREREFLSFALEMRLCCIKIIHAVPCQTET